MAVEVIEHPCTGEHLLLSDAGKDWLLETQEQAARDLEDSDMSKRPAVIGIQPVNLLRAIDLARATGREDVMAIVRKTFGAIDVAYIESRLREITTVAGSADLSGDAPQGLASIGDQGPREVSRPIATAAASRSTPPPIRGAGQT